MVKNAELLAFLALIQQRIKMYFNFAILFQISDKLQALNDDFTAMSKKKKDLEDSIEQCCQKMERAEKLIGGLGGEQEFWRSMGNKLEFKLQQLSGDILISASIITYLGSDDQEYRQVHRFR